MIARKILRILSLSLLIGSILLNGCSRLPTPVTNPPILQNTTQENPTSFPSTTSTHVVEPIPTSPIPTPALIIETIINDQPIILLVSAELKQLGSFSNPYSHVRLSQSGCLLTASGLYKDNTSLLTLNFQGEVVEHRNYAVKANSDEIIHQLVESPNGEWMAYKATRGDYGRSPWDGNLQEVYVFKVEDLPNQKPIKLTKHSGGGQSDLVWSPDNRYLSFVDYDDAGMRQLYIYEPERGVKTQVTQFNEEFIFMSIKWSFDSKVIAFDQYPAIDGELNQNSHNGVLGLISLPEYEYRKIPIDFPALGDASLWWGSENQLLIFASSSESKSDAMFWYSYANDVIKRRKTLTPDMGISMFFDPIPLTDDLNRIAFLGRPSTIYDAITDTFMKVEDPAVSAAINSFFLFFVTSPSGTLRNAECIKEWEGLKTGQ